MFERLTPLRDHIAQIIAGQGSKSSTSLLILAVISVLLRLRKAIRNKKAAKAWREVQGKTAVVTGGSSGIGQEVVRLLSAKSFNVAILDLAAPPTNSVGSRNVRYFKTDVSDPDSVQKACAAVHAAFGKVDVLVNNAGVGNAPGDFLASDIHRMGATIKINTIALFNTTHAFLPDMLASKRGHVVTVASAASFLQCPSAVDYTVSKAGALSFHEGLRNEIDFFYKAPGILTSIVHPSWVATPMVDKLFEPAYVKKFLTSTQIARAIVRQIESGTSGAIYLPWGIRFTPLLRALPHSWQDSIRLAISRDLLKMMPAEEREKFFRETANA